MPLEDPYPDLSFACNALDMQIEKLLIGLNTYNNIDVLIQAEPHLITAFTDDRLNAAIEDYPKNKGYLIFLFANFYGVFLDDTNEP